MEIENYEFGKITISGKTYTSDVIIYPDRVNSSWWRKESHDLCLEDIADILALKPKILIIGRGATGCMEVPEGIIRSIEEKGIRVIAKKTQEACDEYNKLKGQSVVAALHLTC